MRQENSIELQETGEQYRTSSNRRTVKNFKRQENSIELQAIGEQYRTSSDGRLV